ncbi:MAG: tRNA (adenosine(37)-N6)-threonylcarbamoyltransferase complex transferase subunit TsaD [Candidatus Paceibacterota bacterium]
MKILSIETSCDDTAISILKAKRGIQNASFKVLTNNLNSQINIHIPFGGVFPMLAKREHIKNLPILLKQAFKKTKLEKKKKPVDIITVTYGPGLEPSLWTGIVFAKELAQKWKIPLIPVNHMEGHLFSVFGKNKGKFTIPKVKFPILSLLVSGGHTQLILIKEWMEYEIIGETLDDAVGEAFDKVARMLDLPYPGGPEISKLAERQRENLIPLLRGGSLARRSGYQFANSSTSPAKAGTPQEENNPIQLPRPMLYSKNFNFSFSGLKTAVLYLIKDLGGIEKISEQTKNKIAMEFENAAIECLTYKTKKAIEKYEIKTLIVAGGVAANKYLRSEMKNVVNKNTKLIFPREGLSGDNSIMIGIAGYLNYLKNKKKTPKIEKIKAIGNLRL